MNKNMGHTAPALLSLLAALGALAAPAARAEGHYVPGVEGLQGASVPPPGAYYLGYLVNYQMDDFRAPGTSSNLPGHNRGTVTALANRFVWITGRKLLGGRLRHGGHRARDAHLAHGERGRHLGHALGRR